MAAPVTVIVPTLDAARHLPGLAASLFEGLETGLIGRMIVSDGGSTDSTRDIADALGADIVTGAPGRGGQICRAVMAAGSPWLLVLHADTVLEPGWSAPARAHVETDPCRAGYFRLAFRAEGIAPRLVAGWANRRARWLGLPYGDQGLLIARALLEDVGGYSPLPLMEDVDLARRLRGRLVMLPAGASTDAGRYSAEGWWRRGMRNHITMLRYLAGTDPERLARDYRRR